VCRGPRFGLTSNFERCNDDGNTTLAVLAIIAVNAIRSPKVKNLRKKIDP